ncbi:hypothetical protein [Chitinophaga pinensis]|uniref:Uncharacterized protein n=1 Tax=Chitinophaga pinensis (strain ATCC 43595 / DSM 2588 / LMG 13176 / NBRC 15968 / NCIMB 11800 / UQM 2034) TaxID=485918 RepID=A0A979GAH2_CHIPD|nr:hypothetical protein [Chitinophaga pinensis]ACU63734.1 hypothetical protein Cpin_6329 [Chitinophaga pinensis DSM 2588]
MIILKIFAANGELLETRKEGITPDNISMYAKQTSLERVEGYLKCLEDIISGLNDVIWGKHKYRPDSKQMIATNTEKFLGEKQRFLEYGKQNNSERDQGYSDCVEDVVLGLNDIIWGKNKIIPDTRHMIGANTEKFLKEKEKLLKCGKSFVEKMAPENNDPVP